MSQPFGHLSLEEILNHVAEQMESMQGMSSKDIKTVIAWILLFLAASISSAGRSGWWPLFLPILRNLLQACKSGQQPPSQPSWSLEGLSPLSYITSSQGPSLIDYEITLLSQPCLLLGVSVGVFFNIMFPEWLITVLFAAFPGFFYIQDMQCWCKTLEKNETEEIRRRDCGDDEVSLEVATAMDVEIVCATVGTPWAKLVILVFVWLSFFGLHVLLADNDGQNNIVNQNGISTQPKFIFPVAALLSGIVGGLLGIGGGLLINPVLLQIGVPPQTTAATTCFMVLFSSSMSSAQYLILGMKGVKQALVYAQLCIVGSALGLIMMERVVIKSGRASLIVFMVSIVMALSTISITSFGAIDVWSDYTDGKNMGFKLPC
ncbi:sulfite exporter TauE/SafE family protein 5-like [Dioscorea cayenensis subsp. rotundata]|uniref:Sulfite exporter TauE/SafE family protein 5-like n=1 Tax=Dioscorea cayennensis subsp. rotundata TaxID=55577 RepID=A0AB40CIS3_DIOCR|nr:sulfite exporter TauE/SafE family protein 5-like [Dioscorea cayenensis subsp. rotundata]